MGFRSQRKWQNVAFTKDCFICFGKHAAFVGREVNTLCPGAPQPKHNNPHGHTKEPTGVLAHYCERMGVYYFRGQTGVMWRSLSSGLTHGPFLW